MTKQKQKPQEKAIIITGRYRGCPTFWVIPRYELDRLGQKIGKRRTNAELVRRLAAQKDVSGVRVWGAAS